MKLKTIEVYTIDELSEEAQENARIAYITDEEDYSFLSDDMQYKLDELLKDNKIKSDNAKTFYSLSCCQGDGAMVYGDFEWNGYTINIKHSGHYYHSNSKNTEITDEEGNEPETDEPINAFETIYQTICKELEEYGYDVIETNDSMDNFKEHCRANGYTFTLSGKMENI